MTRSRALLTLFVAGAIAAPHVQAIALEREGMAVSRAEPKVTKTYSDPIIANNTSLLHRPSDCESATYCDVIELTIDADDFVKGDVYFVNITMSWTQEYDEEEGVGSNDLDLYIYDSQEVRIAQAATSNETEKTQLDLPETGLYYLVVNNFAGPNLGYTFELELEYQGKLKGIPEFVRPTALPDEKSDPDATPPPPPQLPPTTGSSPPPETKLEPDATLAPIVTPGPDGAPTTLSLEAVQAGGQVESDGLPLWVTLLVTALAAACVGGLAFFTYRRLRARGA